MFSTIISGGALERMSVFVLNVIMPIWLQLLCNYSQTLFILDRAKKGRSSEKKQKSHSIHTRYGTVILAFIQASA